MFLLTTGTCHVNFGEFWLLLIAQTNQLYVSKIYVTYVQNEIFQFCNIYGKISLWMNGPDSNKDLRSDYYLFDPNSIAGETSIYIFL